MSFTFTDIGADVLNVKDITDYFETLDDVEDAEEYSIIGELLAALAGNSGDHRYRGDWYPSTLIEALHFEDYAYGLAEDCGLIPDNLSWPCNCIDWERAAKELQYDYSSVDVGGYTYYFR